MHGADGSTLADEADDGSDEAEAASAPGENHHVWVGGHVGVGVSRNESCSMNTIHHMGVYHTGMCTGAAGADMREAAEAVKVDTMLQVLLSAKDKWPGAVVSVSVTEDTVSAVMDWCDGTARTRIVLAGITRPFAWPVHDSLRNWFVFISACDSVCFQFSLRFRSHYKSCVCLHMLLNHSWCSNVGTDAVQWKVLEDFNSIITYLGKPNAGKLFTGVCTSLKPLALDGSSQLAKKLRRPNICIHALSCSLRCRERL